MRTRSALRIGLISDTHGLLRPQALAALTGSDYIIHAGDIENDRERGGELSQDHGSAAHILAQLSALAPVTAVRGNNDRSNWAAALRTTELLDAGDVRLYAIHDIAELDIDPRVTGVRVIVSGHSHKAVFSWQDDVLFINPGSAGPRRFRLPVSVASLLIDDGNISATIHELAV